MPHSPQLQRDLRDAGLSDRQSVLVAEAFARELKEIERRRVEEQRERERRERAAAAERHFYFGMGIITALILGIIGLAAYAAYLAF